VAIHRLVYRHIFSFCQLTSELAERNSTKTGHMLGSECDLKIYVRNLRHPSPKKSGAEKPFLSTTAQLNGKFNGLSSERYTIYIIGQMRWKLYQRSPTSSQNVELWSTNGLQLDRYFYPPSANSAFYFRPIARLRRRSSANGTQPNFAKRHTVNHAT